jgi:hypothetical protein
MGGPVSAPKVGDRVRVIAGQWRGWHGVVTLTGSQWLDVEIDAHSDGCIAGPWERSFLRAEVEVIEP